MSSDVRKPDTLPYGRTLKQYSIDEKLAIITHAKSHGNRAAGREFNVAESSIREWRKNEMKLINNKNSSMMPSIINNMNNNHHKVQMQKVPRPVAPQDLMRLQFAQYAHSLAMLNMDLNALPHLAPMLPFNQKPVVVPSSPAPPFLSDSPSSSVGTPSSVSSTSSPPPSESSPVLTPAGSGRRKSKIPQKIVAAENVQENLEQD